jgi:hypothetical protein
MCNFVIRPVKSFCTIDIYSEPTKVLIKAGDSFTVSHIEGDTVVGDVNGTAGLAVPLSVYIHSFSLKDPNAKEKKESK